MCKIIDVFEDTMNCIVTAIIKILQGTKKKRQEQLESQCINHWQLHHIILQALLLVGISPVNADTGSTPLAQQVIS